LQAAKQEAAQQSATRQVPSATLAIIGSGVMTWSNDRDRCVNVSDGETPGRLLAPAHVAVCLANVSLSPRLRPCCQRHACSEACSRRSGSSGPA